MDPRERMGRRGLFGLMVSGLATAAAACAPAGAPTTIVNTPEGRVLQWESEGMTVLVSGVQDEYRAGEPLKVTVLLNNSASIPATARVRTRLLGRGQQAVVEAEVASLTIGAEGASTVDRQLDLPRSLAPGEYTLTVEIPPWRLDRREVGGGRLSTDVRVRGSST
ncbi:MAG TPA: hypothetical protein VHX16_18475 [Chloroflexota bacterium]|nr:hypothetical protein [Chloroflexota bacterium]